MKKVLFILSGVLAFAASLSAQITIDTTNAYPNSNSVFGRDEVRTIVVDSSFSTSPYDFFKPDTNHTWDLSGIVYTNESKVYVRKPAPSPYRFIDSIYNEDLGPLRHTSYGLNFFTLGGILEFGQLTYGQAIRLDSFTGNVADTLFIRVQANVQYSGFNVKLKFPLMYDSTYANSTWMSNYYYTEGFTVKGPSFKENTNIVQGDTFRAKRFVTVSKRDTVVGYGRLRVKDLSGNIQSYDTVLQVQTITYERDSFGLVTISSTGIDSLTVRAKDSARKSLFKAYLQSNGMDTVMNYNTTTYKFHRRHHLHPFVTVFMNAGDTIVNRVEVQTNEPWPAAVGNVDLAKSADVTVYPNPVSDHLVTVALNNATDGKWNAELVNNMGQVVTAQPLKLGAANKNAQVTIPAALAPGVYYLRVSKDGVPVAIRPLSVLN